MPHNSVNRKKNPEPAIGVWHDPRLVEPPENAVGLVVAVTLTCDCAKGGRTALAAGRIEGQWVIEDCHHEFTIDHWLRLPAFLPAVTRH